MSDSIKQELEDGKARIMRLEAELAAAKLKDKFADDYSQYVTMPHLDDVDVSKVRVWEEDFLRFIESSREDVLKAVRTKRQLDVIIFKSCRIFSFIIPIA